MLTLASSIASSKVKDLHKAIFAVREIFQTHVYQTRGMSCAVDVQGSVLLVTWRGVVDRVDHADCNDVVMDRFAKDFAKNVNKYRLQKPTVTTIGSFSFLSTKTENDSDNFTILPCRALGIADIQVSDFTAYSFSGQEKIKLIFKYNKIKKEHELITDGDEWKKRVTEKTSVLGCPIVVDKRQVVGVVGVNDGKIVPCFITEEEISEYNFKFQFLLLCEFVIRYIYIYVCSY